MRAELFLWMFVQMGLGVGAYFFNAGQVGFFAHSGEQITTGIRKDLFKALLPIANERHTLPLKQSS